MLKRFHSVLFYASDLNKTLEFYNQLGFDSELEGNLRGLEGRVQQIVDPVKRAKAEAAFVQICELFGIQKEA